MSARELRFVERFMPWMRQHASVCARSSRFTDTSEVLSSAIGRMALVPPSERPDDTAMIRSLASTVLWQTAAEHERSGYRRTKRERLASMKGADSEGSIFDTASVLEIKLRRMLSPEQYRVLELTGTGLSSDQIALREGVSPSAVRSRLCKAREIARELIEDSQGFSGIQA